MSALLEKIVLIGNPNVGKSLIFSRITGYAAISANYPGATVCVKSGKFKFNEAEYEMFDLPGIYALVTHSKAEETAVELLEKADIIINVVDATNLERNLNLTLMLLGLGKPLIVCLNLWDETKHKGITIDSTALQQQLTVPVVPVSALSGEGIPDLVAALKRARPGTRSYEEADRWRAVGSVVGQVQTLTHRHHTPLELLSDITLHPLGGPVSALAVLAATFMIVRFIGETMLNAVCAPFYIRVYQPLILQLSTLIPIDIIREILIGNAGDPLQAFGILTTGVYIALVLVFPYFFAFYGIFGLLEDFGYLPRLAVVLDALFHRLGLHGDSSIPVMLGLGCKVPAFLAMRTMTDKREKILTTALILMSAPCLPQSVMIFSMGMHYSAAAVIVVFAILVLVSIGINILLNKKLPGECPEFFMEIPSYRMPSLPLVARKLWTRIVEYALEVFPMIIMGVLVIHVLEALQIIKAVSRYAGWPLASLLGLPREIAPVMILGFLRKDVSIALLAPFHLSGRQFIVASIFMVLYIPCIASFFTLVKELSVVTTLKICALVFSCALATAGLLNAIFYLTRIGL